MIELVVFDMAGTTVEDGDAVNASFRAALLGAGIEVNPAAVNAVMGLPKPEAIRLLLAGAGRPFGDADVQTIHEDFVRRMRDYYAFDSSVREMPGAAAAFAALRRAGIRVALNTGFSRAVAGVVLQRLGWHAPAVIDADVASDEVPRGRPHPDMIRLLMARLGIQDPRRVAKVGDTKVDLEEGANAGCGLVIGVTSGAFNREQLRAYPHTHILDSVAEVLRLLLSVGSPGAEVMGQV
jgi:phosphonatase-like hydrolase